MYVSPILLSSLKHLGLSKNLMQASSKRWVAGEYLTIERQQAMYRKEELGKITGIAPYRSMALEVARLSQCDIGIPPAVFHSLKDAIFTNGNIYSNRAKHLIAGNTRSLYSKITREMNTTGVVVANRQSHQYFGHWLHDELPMTIFCQNHGRVLTSHFGKKPYIHEAGYYEALQTPPPTELDNNCLYKEISILEPAPLNSVQVESLRQFRKRFSHLHSKKKEVAFIRRGGNNHDNRNLENEDAIINFMLKIGGTIISPEKDTAKDIIENLLDAKLVIGIEGSHLANALLSMPEHGCLLVIQPPNRFNNIFKDYCDVTYRKYAFTIGDSISGRTHQNITHLQKMIDACI